ncbi:hypothetical protein TrLO_g5200 [Triparma laevis f. longispina]|uniref:Malic enzyme n=1 Tax=Triparma laevis f. longispina TaxID=1714387 RepID=A0A9W7A9F0_9STRA|nr:hypothetical protein TrLO_g5200 [Triparma laevis f. longispina]
MKIALKLALLCSLAANIQGSPGNPSTGLPSSSIPLKIQANRVLSNLREKSSDLEKYVYLRTIAESNEDLYFATLISNVAEVMPIVYTPTVGQACQKFSQIYTSPLTPSRSNGLFVNLSDLGSVSSVLDSYPSKDVKCIVVTDGERILGLGDQGANGMGIPIGKLALYCACAGIDPKNVLPIVVDVGTNNEGNLKDEHYIGLRRKRERGEKYDLLIEELVESVKEKYGESCLIQFEDFGNSNAFRVLEKYQNTACCFNDDIQGTASVVLAGIIASKGITGMDLKDHRFLFLGAGEAGVGIANLIAYAISDETGCSIDEARKQIHLVDSKGLVCEARAKSGEKLAHHKLPYTHPASTDLPTTSLLDCVNSLNPTALIGVSAIPNTFTQEVVEQMANNHANPLIFALSNPTSKAECTAEQAYNWSGGRCVFASGSPFAKVELSKDVIQTTFGTKNAPYRHKSNVRVPGQGNNAYVFPGIGLGIIASGATRVSDKDMLIAARTLAKEVKSTDLSSGSVYPPLSQIRDVSLKIATKVAENAYEEGTATVERPKNLQSYIQSTMYDPEKK